ncbi:hypothetical protein CBR_g52659 [Chara braunii]|uniref:Uncharacterized protein n=1 Tax=Chara braunii TaxID=69332 RepID=A0A388MAT7_CHABU|nr:hypothetical protein CBR_g52659 [Chara braunii]|eukprot:GBG91625.1 hypothetical protein CBR_g52659 [Chara braunii]
MYKFLFFDTLPKLRFEDDYKGRQDVVIGALDDFHGASRESAANFVEKLEECYLDNGKMKLTLNYYKAHFMEEDNFNANGEEEVSEVIDGEWIMAFKDKGEWKSDAHLSKRDFEEAALQAVIDHVAEVNCREPEDIVVKMFGELKYEILREHNMLEICRDFYYLELSSSYEAKMDWHILPADPTHGEGTGRKGDDGGDDSAYGGDGGGHDDRGGGAGRRNVASSRGGTTGKGGMSGIASVEGASSQTGHSENLTEKTAGTSYSPEMRDSLASPCAPGSDGDKGQGLRVGSFTAGSGCIRRPSGRISAEQKEDLVVGSISVGGGSIRSSTQQPNSTNNTLPLGMEDQETPPPDTHYGGSEHGYVPLLYSGLEDKLRSDVTPPVLDMRPLKLLTATVRSDQCDEDEDVTMLEVEEVTVRRPLEDDLVKTLFRESCNDEYSSPVIISSWPRLLTPQNEVFAIRKSVGTTCRTVQLCPDEGA